MKGLRVSLADVERKTPQEVARYVQFRVRGVVFRGNRVERSSEFGAKGFRVSSSSSSLLSLQVLECP